MAIGRPPEAGTARDVVVCVRYTQAEIAVVDRERGTATRSARIRYTSLHAEAPDPEPDDG